MYIIYTYTYTKRARDAQIVPPGFTFQDLKNVLRLAGKYIYIYVYIHVCVCVYMSVCVCVHVYMCI